VVVAVKVVGMVCVVSTWLIRVDVLRTVELTFEINVVVVKLVSVVPDELEYGTKRTAALPIATMTIAPRMITIATVDIPVRAFTSLKPNTRGVDVSSH
jgi:hypothetical protein